MEKFLETEILLVEDNKNDAEMAMRAFKKNNLTNKIYVVEDGEQALNFLYAEGIFADRKNSQNPKIILLDLQLPKINGLQVLEKIKSDPEKQVIPVIVLTSSKEEKDITESYKLGVNSYIVKPVEFDKFVDAVRGLGFYWLLLNQPPLID